LTTTLRTAIHESETQLQWNISSVNSRDILAKTHQREQNMTLYLLSSMVFWVVTPCSLVQTELGLLPVSAGFLLGLLFNLEDGDNMFL
jgi:hypothetical protein